MDQQVQPPTIPPSTDSASPHDVPLHGVPAAPAANSPLGEAAQTFQPQPTVVASANSKMKKIFYALLILWLVSLPFAVVFQFVYRMVIVRAGEGIGPAGVIINLISLVLGLVGVLGWIPVLVTGIMAWGHKRA